MSVPAGSGSPGRKAPSTSAGAATKARVFRSYFEGSQMLKDALERSLRSVHDISLADYNIMLLLRESPQRLCMRDLAERLVFIPSRLTYAIRSLSTRGFVEQVQSVQDKRMQEVVLTDLGRDVFDRARATHRKDVDRLFFSHIRPRELEVIERVFGRIASV
ncbi:MarR family winged helix-turn-helix transcriptional regulator [Arthrobacter sp. UM1]|uniref:MarR family winged helix-turn-helix transcriptional regulator n=1 Tax=Arthrobacter sp. UM1 TaxID=2766776 RepID=UPI001CF61F89|nr:MarR family transcriptional regulator [Arthrobacter sp. UM1]MCB4209112.1 MarR family transcriptional regulator [Arthrobacter sp. UM1]